MSSRKAIYDVKATWLHVITYKERDDGEPKSETGDRHHGRSYGYGGRSRTQCDPPSRWRATFTLSNDGCRAGLGPGSGRSSFDCRRGVAVWSHNPGDLPGSVDRSRGRLWPDHGGGAVVVGSRGTATGGERGQHRSLGCYRAC